MTAVQQDSYLNSWAAYESGSVHAYGTCPPNSYHDPSQAQWQDYRWGPYYGGHGYTGYDAQGSYTAAGYGNTEAYPPPPSNAPDASTAYSAPPPHADVYGAAAQAPAGAVHAQQRPAAGQVPCGAYGWQAGGVNGGNYGAGGWQSLGHSGGAMLQLY
jgi:hypothetical protein